MVPLRQTRHQGPNAFSARAGFTLIELMIAMAAMIILLGAVFAVNFRVSDLWIAQRERSQIQQNFRFALDAITQEMRQATAVGLPVENTFGDKLEFTLQDPADATKVDYVSYSMAADPARSGASRIMRTVAGTPSTPVTESIPELAALYFIRSGNRVVMIAVARYKVFGTEQTMSYTTQTFTRISGTN